MTGPRSIHSRVRFVAQALDETLASEPQMFSHSGTGQESQVLMKHVLIDGVLSLHHSAFKPQNKGEKHVTTRIKEDRSKADENELEGCFFFVRYYSAELCFSMSSKLFVSIKCIFF